MPRPDKFVSLSSGELSFLKPGNYTLDFTGSSVSVSRGGGAVFTDAEWATVASVDLGRINKLSLTGISFQEAGPGGPYEASDNLDALLGAILSSRGLDWAFDHVTVNSDDADLFRALWDYLDDQYVAGGNYYDLPLNEMFVRLGVKYVEYLEAGGEPLTFDTAKFEADNNANGIPQREQSLHDNLLGNLSEASILARNFGSPLEDELLDLVSDDYQARPWYSGNESHRGGASHDAVRAFDYDKGWDRPDYLDTTFNGTVDPLARDGGSMYYGTGNTIDDWNVVRHEGAQLELALKVKHRQGDEYAEAYVDGDGIAHYEVLAGAQPGNPNRAEWSFDFSAVDYSPDSDFTYAVEIDVDPGEGVSWLTVYSSDMPFDTDVGDGSLFQNSSNYAFYAAFVDSDPDAPGVQAYMFGEGEFNIRFSARDSVTDALVLSHEVVVHVPEFVI